MISFAVGLGGGEAHLALAVDRDDRVLARRQAGRGRPTSTSDSSHVGSDQLTAVDSPTS